MKLTVAGNKKEYEEGLTVRKLIELEDVESPMYVTVTVNAGDTHPLYIFIH